MTREEAMELSATAAYYADGGAVQVRHRYSVGDIWWDVEPGHDWNLQTYEYRPKPQSEA